MTEIPDNLTWWRVNQLVSLATREQGHWAGVPIPLEGFRLVIEETHPLRESYDRHFHPEPPPPEDLVNAWYSRRRECECYIVRHPETGRPELLTLPRRPFAERLTTDLQTLGVADVWPLEAEAAALSSLAARIGERRFHQYLLTGMFVETSRLSGVTCLFRRLRPTLALRDPGDGHLRCLAALCLHPIAYYAETRAGAMVPTDDVLAHLLLLRADEPYFWRKANQHAPDHPTAAI